MHAGMLNYDESEGHQESLRDALEGALRVGDDNRAEELLRAWHCGQKQGQEKLVRVVLHSGRGSSEGPSVEIHEEVSGLVRAADLAPGRRVQGSLAAKAAEMDGPKALLELARASNVAPRARAEAARALPEGWGAHPGGRELVEKLASTSLASRDAEEREAFARAVERAGDSEAWRALRAAKELLWDTDARSRAAWLSALSSMGRGGHMLPPRSKDMAPPACEVVDAGGELAGLVVAGPDGLGELQAEIAVRACLRGVMLGVGGLVLVGARAEAGAVLENRLRTRAGGAKASLEGLLAAVRRLANGERCPVPLAGVAVALPFALEQASGEFGCAPSPTARAFLQANNQAWSAWLGRSREPLALASLNLGLPAAAAFHAARAAEGSGTSLLPWRARAHALAALGEAEALVSSPGQLPSAEAEALELQARGHHEEALERIASAADDAEGWMAAARARSLAELGRFTDLREEAWCPLGDADLRALSRFDACPSAAAPAVPPFTPASNGSTATAGLWASLAAEAGRLSHAQHQQPGEGRVPSKSLRLRALFEEGWGTGCQDEHLWALLSEAAGGGWRRCPGPLLLLRDGGDSAKARRIGDALRQVRREMREREGGLPTGETAADAARAALAGENKRLARSLLFWAEERKFPLAHAELALRDEGEEEAALRLADSAGWDDEHPWLALSELLAVRSRSRQWRFAGAHAEREEPLNAGLLWMRLVGGEGELGANEGEDEGDEESWLRWWVAREAARRFSKGGRARMNLVEMCWERAGLNGTLARPWPSFKACKPEVLEECVRSLGRAAREGAGTRAGARLLALLDALGAAGNNAPHVRGAFEVALDQVSRLVGEEGPWAGLDVQVLGLAGHSDQRVSEVARRLGAARAAKLSPGIAYAAAAGDCESDAAGQAMEAIRSSTPASASEIREAVRRLASVAVLPEDAVWAKVSAARRQLERGREDPDKVAERVESLLAEELCALSLHEERNHHRAESPRRRTVRWRLRRKAEVAAGALRYGAEAGKEALDALSGSVSSLLEVREIPLAEASPALAESRAFTGAAPLPGGSGYLVGVAGPLRALQSKTRPKRLGLVDESGRSRQHILKGGESLHADELVAQLGAEAGRVLAERSNQAGHSLPASYVVRPLGAGAGIAEWVEGAEPLDGIFRRWQAERKEGNEKAGGRDGDRGDDGERAAASERPAELFHRTIAAELRQRGMDPFQARGREQWPEECLEAAFDRLQAGVPKDILRKAFWRAAPCAGSAVEAESLFARSLAAGSALGHAFGLGDRHPGNVLIDTRSARAVHVDLGVCFGRGERLRVPEIVPFRLTRLLVGALGLPGPHGPFEHSLARDLASLREAAPGLLSLARPALLWRPPPEWSGGGGAMRRDFQRDEGVMKRRASDLATAARHRIADAAYSVASLAESNAASGGEGCGERERAERQKALEQAQARLEASESELAARREELVRARNEASKVVCAFSLASRSIGQREDVEVGDAVPLREWMEHCGVEVARAIARRQTKEEEEQQRAATVASSGGSVAEGNRQRRRASEAEHDEGVDEEGDPGEQGEMAEEELDQAAVALERAGHGLREAEDATRREATEEDVAAAERDCHGAEDEDREPERRDAVQSGVLTLAAMSPEEACASAAGACKLPGEEEVEYKEEEEIGWLWAVLTRAQRAGATLGLLLKAHPGSGAARTAAELAEAAASFAHSALATVESVEAELAQIGSQPHEWQEEERELQLVEEGARRVTGGEEAGDEDFGALWDRASRVASELRVAGKPGAAALSKGMLSLSNAAGRLERAGRPAAKHLLAAYAASLRDPDRVRANFESLLGRSSALAALKSAIDMAVAGAGGVPPASQERVEALASAGATVALPKEASARVSSASRRLPTLRASLARRRAAEWMTGEGSTRRECVSSLDRWARCEEGAFDPQACLAAAEAERACGSRRERERRWLRAVQGAKSALEERHAALEEVDSASRARAAANRRAGAARNLVRQMRKTTASLRNLLRSGAGDLRQALFLAKLLPGEENERSVSAAEEAGRAIEAARSLAAEVCERGEDKEMGSLATRLSSAALRIPPRLDDLVRSLGTGGDTEGSKDWSDLVEETAQEEEQEEEEEGVADKQPGVNGESPLLKGLESVRREGRPWQAGIEALEVCQSRLLGLEGGRGAGEEESSADQASRLIRSALSRYNLSRMYEGWAAWI